MQNFVHTLQYRLPALYLERILLTNNCSCNDMKDSPSKLQFASRQDTGKFSVSFPTARNRKYVFEGVKNVTTMD